MIQKLDSTEPDHTFGYGANIGKYLKGDEIILLSGGLGAGKTLFTKGIARALGIDPSDIVSPTFTLMNRYDADEDVHLYHLDLYRLGTGESLIMPELDEIIGEGIIVVEWAQFLSPLYFKLPNVIAVYIEIYQKRMEWREIRVETSLDYIFF